MSWNDREADRHTTEITREGKNIFLMEVKIFIESPSTIFHPYQMTTNIYKGI